MIRGTINSSQRLIVFFTNLIECCAVLLRLIIFFSFLGGSRKNSNMLLQQVDCSLHYLVVPNCCYHSSQAKIWGRPSK